MSFVDKWKQNRVTDDLLEQKSAEKSDGSVNLKKLVYLISTKDYKYLTLVFPSPHMVDICFNTFYVYFDAKLFFQKHF